MSAVIQATSVQPTTIASLPQAGSALLVIFGASGDLTRRKLIPRLYDLTCVGCVPPSGPAEGDTLIAGNHRRWRRLELTLPH